MGKFLSADEAVPYVLDEVKLAIAFVDKMNLPQMKYQIGELSKSYQKNVVDQVSPKELINSINICSNKIDALKDAIILLAHMLDTVGSSNFEVAVKTQLK